MGNSDTTEKSARIRDAIEKLKRPDKVGVAGVGLGTGAGVAGGSVAAGTLASAAGATTLLGSSSLASILGGVFVTATPVGWVVGCGLAGGLAGYGIAKMIKSGAKQDQIRQEIIKSLQARLDAMKQSTTDGQTDLRALKIALSETMKRDLISADQAERMVKLVEAKKLKIDIALTRLRTINKARPTVK